MWTQESLSRLTELLRLAGRERWSEICVNLNIKKGYPLNLIASVKYGNRTTADEYVFKSVPRYDEMRNVVVVENPWYVKEFKKPDHPLLGEYIELDAEIAMKILILEYVT